MIGAIIGDMVGSIYEGNQLKSKDFDIFNKQNFMTDDSLLTISVMNVLRKNYPIKYTKEGLDKIKKDLIIDFCNTVEDNQSAGWGFSFYDWAMGYFRNNYEPYNSYGNGAGMRISPVGWVANSIEEVKLLSKAVTEITHNHPEGIKGAESIAMCIYLALHGYSKEDIKQYVIENYYPQLEYLEFDKLVKNYHFDITCQGSCPEAIYCFLISTDEEDAIRNVIAIGGDADTIGAMTGAIAEAFYHPHKCSEFENKFMDKFFSAQVIHNIKKFHELVGKKEIS